MGKNAQGAVDLPNPGIDALGMNTGVVVLLSDAGMKFLLEIYVNYVPFCNIFDNC